MKKLTSKQKRILIAKLIRISVDGLMYLGIFSLWGSVGALEVERIEFHQFIVQVIISLALILFSRYAHYRIYEEDSIYE